MVQSVLEYPDDNKNLVPKIHRSPNFSTPKLVDDSLDIRRVESGGIDLGLAGGGGASRRFSRTGKSGGRRKAGSEKVWAKRKPHFRLYALPPNSRISVIIREYLGRKLREPSSFPPLYSLDYEDYGRGF